MHAVKRGKAGGAIFGVADNVAGGICAVRDVRIAVGKSEIKRPESLLRFLKTPVASQIPVLHFSAVFIFGKLRVPYAIFFLADVDTAKTIRTTYAIEKKRGVEACIGKKAEARAVKAVTVKYFIYVVGVVGNKSIVCVPGKKVPIYIYWEFSQ